MQRLEPYLKRLPFNGGPRIQVETFTKLRDDLNQWAREQWSLAQKGCIRIIFIKSPNYLFVAVPQELIIKQVILPDDIRYGKEMLAQAGRPGSGNSMDEAIEEGVSFFNAAYIANIKEMQTLKTLTGDRNFLRPYMTVAAVLVGMMGGLLLWTLFLPFISLIRTYLVGRSPIR